MKKIFLTSSFIDVADYLESFVGESSKGKTVTFIPTAGKVEEYVGYIDDDRKALKALGILIDELDIDSNNYERIAEKILKNDYLFVSGGNTFYLLQELKNSGADQLIIDHITKGKLYIGVSAGSVILSPNIEYIKLLDDPGKANKLNGFTGLNILDFYPLPHYTNEPFREAVEGTIYQKKDILNLVPISNTEAIEVKGENYTVIGNQ